MSGLKALQLAFLEAVYHEDDRLESWLEEGGVAKDKRIGIYRENVRMVLTNALKLTYPAVCTLVDERFFDYAAHNYIKQHPSVSGNLDEYGADFSAFLKDFEPTHALPYLGEVAALEWAHHLSYGADDPKETIDIQELAKISPEAYAILYFEFHPSVQLVQASYPVLALWKLGQGEGRPEDINLQAGGEEVLLIRPELSVEAHRLPQGHYAFLCALKQGKALCEAFEVAEEAYAGFDMAEALAMYVQNGTFCGFRK